jgi:hypothetical protein
MAMKSGAIRLSGWRTAAMSIAVSLVSTLLSLLLLELAVSLLLPQYSATGDVAYTTVDGVPLAPANTTLVQWKNTGDYRVQVSINRWGLRDVKDHSAATVDDLFVVGDSFAFGYGVEEDERFSNRLEALVEQRVFNVAVPTDIEGYATLIAYAERNGAPVRRIILAICMENDIGRYRDHITPVSQLRQRRSVAEGLRRTKLWLQRHSTAYRAFAHSARTSPQFEALLVRLGLIVPDKDGALRNVYSAAAIEQSAERVASIAARHQLITVIIPSRLKWIGNNLQQEQRVHVDFVERLRTLGLAVVDLAPAFEDDGEPLDRHFPNDGHWNPSGHALAAAEIASHIRAQGWPEPMGHPAALRRAVLPTGTGGD